MPTSSMSCGFALVGSALSTTLSTSFNRGFRDVFNIHGWPPNWNKLCVHFNMLATFEANNQPRNFCVDVVPGVHKI